MKFSAYITVVLLLVACRDWEIPSFDDTTTPPNVTIGHLKGYIPHGTELTFTKDSIVISGRVVSSDLAGNFYNTFFIDDGTGAVEIMAGMPYLDAVYRPGRRVAVHALGLAVGWRDGVMQLGLPPDPGNRYATGYFSHRAVIGEYVKPERSVEKVAPITTSLGELDLSMCGRLVAISGLTVDGASTAETWAQTEPGAAIGYVKFRSSPVDSITVVTSGYASFALMPIPRGEVTLTGILLYGKGNGSREHYLLKLRDEKDIVF